MKVDVIIPAYNEEERMASTLKSLRKEPWINQIIVVDDGSRDKTRMIAEEYADKVISHSENKGKTAAIFSGLLEATGEWIILLDADLGETAREGKKLLIPLANKEADLTVAILPQFSRRGFGFVKRRAQGILLGNHSFSMIAPLSGQRAFHRGWISNIMKKKSYRFGFEMHVNLIFLQHGGKIKEVETSMSHRSTGKDLKGLVHRARQWIEMEITYGLNRD